MFGYIMPSKEHLGEDDFNTFCSYYCGLCKSMGKHCSHASRLGLSYDLTFLSIVLSSVVEENVEMLSQHCIIHPIKKKNTVKSSYILEYTAMMATILAYEKCKDDVHDDKSIKALLGMLMYSSAYKKAIKKHSEASLYISNRLKELREIEKNRICDIDIAADKFALILQKLFTPDFITDKNTIRQLEWFGYNIGRWIYILDAINDLESDFKSKSYNPLLCDNIENIKEYCISLCEKTEQSLTFTLENAAEAFDLMKLYRNSELLNKMIYISLPFKQSQVLGKYRRNI